jgi:protein-disulfide isomerase
MTLTVPVGKDDHTDGPADAPVTLVEYGDYECPHCGAAYPIVKAVQKRLHGSLRFVFRNFPLNQAHPHAELAAEAAEAAAAQGQFWPMHDAIFEHQDDLSLSAVLSLARALGLNMMRFESDLSARRFLEHVKRDFTGGVRSGVNGTPTFFINGKRYDESLDETTLLHALRSQTER